MQSLKKADKGDDIKEVSCVYTWRSGTPIPRPCTSPLVIDLLLPHDPM